MSKIAVKPMSAVKPPVATIALVQSNSLPMLVQKELERMILAGDLAVGAKLNEVAIAERLGVSRGPVREAFRALEESGLVRLEKNRGVFVRQVSLEEADEIFEVRATLEEWAGRRVAKRATALEVRELQALVEGMEHAAGRGGQGASRARDGQQGPSAQGASTGQGRGTPRACQYRRKPEAAMSTATNEPRSIEVNGRQYAWPGKPVVVVCVDGCEPDYINQA